LPSARLPDLQEIASRQASKNSRQPSAARERTHERPPVNPRSADVYASKNKKYYSQATSDQEDASTSVSTRSQVRRPQPGSLGAPVNYSHHGHVSQTPQATHAKASDLKSCLPSIMDRRSNGAVSQANYDSYEPVAYRSRLGYRKQMESAGISRAMGVNRYEGVGNALRMARELSREQIPEVAAVKMQRGPCPGHLRNPSIPSLLTEEER